MPSARIFSRIWSISRQKKGEDDPYFAVAKLFVSSSVRRTRGREKLEICFTCDLVYITASSPKVRQRFLCAKHNFEVSRKDNLKRKNCDNEFLLQLVSCRRRGELFFVYSQIRHLQFQRSSECFTRRASRGKYSLR